MSDDPDDDQDAGQDTGGSAGVFTLPEITITGSASAADSDTQDSDTTSPVLAGIMTDPLSPGTGGPPPSWSPDFNLQPPTTPGFEPPLGFEPPPPVSLAPEAAPALGVAPEAALGPVAAGAAFAGGFVVGAVGPFAVGYAIDHAQELNQAPDPDLQSLPGGAPLPVGPDLDAGAPQQTTPPPAAGPDLDAGAAQQANPPSASLPPLTPLPTAQDPVTGQPLYTPADGEYSPAIDPATGQPFQAPPSDQGNEQIEAAPKFTTNPDVAMAKLGLTKQQFNLAIHNIKSQVEGNPDMRFDLTTGDVIDQRDGEVVGNLLDFKN